MQDAADRVDLSIIHIVLFVKAERLKEVDAWSGSSQIVWCEVVIRWALIKVVLHDLVKETEQVVLQSDYVLLEICLIDDRAAVLKTHEHIVEEVVDGLVIVRDIEVGAHHDLLNSNLPEPLLVLGVIRYTVSVVWSAVRVICGAPLVVEDYVLEDGGVPVALDGQVLPVGAIVLLNAIVLYLGHVLVQEVDSNPFILGISTSINIKSYTYLFL